MSPKREFDAINERIAAVLYEQERCAFGTTRYWELESERYGLLAERDEAGERLYAALKESAEKIAAYRAEHGELGLADYVNAM